MSAEKLLLEGARRVVVIGNGGGGKSTLSKAIAERHGLPWHEVDKLQFRPEWERTPETEVRADIQAIIETPTWILDGFGPWDTIEARCDVADTLIFVDFPIWVHFWWAAERQIAAALGEQRLGGPEGCDLRLKNKWMFETLWRVHEQLRPKLSALAEKHRNRLDLHHIQSPESHASFLTALESRSTLSPSTLD